MPNRKEIRKKARLSLKKHYWIFVVACLLAAILGTEYENTLQSFQLQKRVNEAKEESSAPALGVSRISGEMSVFNDLVNGDIDKVLESLSRRISMYQAEDRSLGDWELGHSRGILASVVNYVASGSLVYNILTLFDTILTSKKLSVIILAVTGFLLMLLFWLFVGNAYRVGYSRVFLEGRLYEKIPFSRFVFLYRVRKHVKASFAMAVYTLLTYVWMITIVVYPVKRYAYLLAPYLVAENPDLGPMEAIRLSQRMMKGHKWEAFRLELSLFPWMLLSAATGGLAGLFFSNPYRESVFAEYYASVRQQALEGHVEGCERLTDRYLFEHPGQAELDAAYADVKQKSGELAEALPVRKGFWGFMEKYFGIVLSYDEAEKAFRNRTKEKEKIAEYLGAAEGRTYPARMFPIPEVRRREKSTDAGYTRHYALTSVILLFFTGCFVGWLWEVGLHLLQAGEFVNRGVLHGPWLPIYGGGAVLVLVVLYRFRKKVFTEFILIVVLCGCVEYFTSWLLEVLHDGQQWWNYDGYYLNLNGRICAEGLLVFGIAGMAFIYVLAPAIDNLLEKIRAKILWPICGALLIVFAADVIYSAFVPNTGKGITEGSTGETASETVVQETENVL